MRKYFALIALIFGFFGNAQILNPVQWKTKVVQKSATEFELVMDAIANGATPVRFDNGNGTSMSAFFVMGSEWVHTVSSIPELNFGIGVVESSFVDFFKGIVMPYIEAE